MPEKRKKKPEAQPITQLQVEGLSKLTIEEAILLGIHPVNHLFHRMIAVTLENLGRYYQAHPDRSDDERGKEAIDETVMGLGELMDLITSDYDISYKAPSVDDSPPHPPIIL